MQDPLQRDHWYAKEDAAGDHEPVEADSVLPVIGWPEIVGAAVLVGALEDGLGPGTVCVDAGAMSAVGVLTAETYEVPLAVTVERSVWPTSADVAVYELADAPAMAAQFAPASSQRLHPYEYDAIQPDHVPFEVVSTWPA